MIDQRKDRVRMLQGKILDQHIEMYTKQTLDVSIDYYILYVHFVHSRANLGNVVRLIMTSFVY
jgi:hypothetical protein